MRKEIPVVSDEIMEQVDKLLYHGGQRAKSHDMRLGQWLLNKIVKKYPRADVGTVLFNIENPEILEMLRDYNV